MKRSGLKIMDVAEVLYKLKNIIEKIKLLDKYELIKIFKDFELGLDIRTAAYISSIQKVYNVYKDAGFA